MSRNPENNQSLSRKYFPDELFLNYFKYFKDSLVFLQITPTQLKPSKHDTNIFEKQTDEKI